MGVPYLKIINTNQGYIQKYEDLKMVVLVKLFTISKDGSVVFFSGNNSTEVLSMQCQRHPLENG
jgi:hypothetical protein